MSGKIMNGKVARKVKDDRGVDKGFGFIKGDDGRDYFFHKSAVKRADDGWSFTSMEEGDEVLFTIGQGEKGPRAENVEQA